MWWIVMFVTSWGVVLFATTSRQWAAFWTGGLWSIALASLGEGLIRYPLDFFPRESLLIPVLGSDLLHFIGPRFVEGLLYMQTLDPIGRFVRTILWIVAVVVSEMLVVIGHHGTITFHGTGIALAVHTLRFLSLLGVFYGLGYYERHLGFTLEMRRQLIARVHRIIWPLSWPVLWAGAGLFSRLSRIGQRKAGR